MPPFKGFPEGKARQVPVPEAFFRELLAQIDDLHELKLTAYIFYRLEQSESTFRYVTAGALAQDAALLQSLDPQAERAQEHLKAALERAVERGVLLCAPIQADSGPEKIYLLNSPKGRAALRAIQSGQWQPGGAVTEPEPPPEAPNIFRLYEENIGPLTPLIADALRDAEESYPADWIAEAIAIAVEGNKRTWRYVNAILERWKREGKHGRKEKQDRPAPGEDRRKYIEGDYSDFVKH